MTFMLKKTLLDRDEEPKYDFNWEGDEQVIEQLIESEEFRSCEADEKNNFNCTK